MKKLLCLLVISFMIPFILLCACSESIDYQATADIRQKCIDFDKKISYEASFRLNMTFSDENATLLFAQGNYTADFSSGSAVVNATMSQVALGSASAVTVNYAEGKAETVTGSDRMTEEIAEDEFFGRIIYTKPFIPNDESISSTEMISTALGKGCKAQIKSAEGILFRLVGEGIYSLAGVTKPKKDMTEIYDGEITYIYGESGITNMTVSFVLHLVQTPPYVPNGMEPEYDYIDIKVDFTVNYR